MERNKDRERGGVRDEEREGDEVGEQTEWNPSLLGILQQPPY